MNVREIKFRGQSVINNQWEHGYFTFEGGYHVIRSFVSEWHKEGSPIIVKGNTVCQFTGLFDKNGNEIYEGDVYDIGICSKVIRSTHFIGDTYELMKMLQDNAKVEVIGNIYENPELLR